ncbi:MAG: hypothetical protein H6698_09650 [Myxococcales bacterium]|nr:hypothetical protein [Myxococcales bacterium]MCB9532644.1 hypothetical protein [Myxococcales bacterium]MCB9534546.1 hypothetical protein [Myxococcales bacterium]
MTQSTWSQHMGYGYEAAHALLIEGVPLTLADRHALRVDAAAEPDAADGTVLSCALSLTDDAITGERLERQRGVASGRAVEVFLAWDELEREGLLADLFSAPAYTARLTTPITDAATTTVEVDDTTGWPSSGTLCIGLETMTYSGKTSKSFTGCTRGVGPLGRTHVHRADASSGYAEVTDRPTRWAGRLAMMYEHLVSPEGRVVPDTWATPAAGICRERWLAVVDGEPAYPARGVRLRLLPIESLLGHAAVGGEVKGRALTWRTGGAGATVYVGASDKITLTVVHSGGTSQSVVPHAPHNVPSNTLDFFRRIVEADANTDLSGETWATVDPSVSAEVVDLGFYAELIITVKHDGSVEDVFATSECWFLDPVSLPGDRGERHVTVRFPLRPPGSPPFASGWLPVEIAPSEDGEYPELPASGYAVVTMGDGQEIIAYDDVIAQPLYPRWVALHVSQRLVGTNGIYGPRSVDLWGSEGDLAIVAGAVGLVYEAIEILLTSSGLGDRGSYDTAPHGYGLGLPAAYIDTASLRRYPLDQWCIVASDSQSSVADLVGGWLVLYELCLVQRRTSADTGDIKLAVVSTAVGAEEAGTDLDADRVDELSVSNILIGSPPGTPEPVESPNEVRVARGVLTLEAATTERDPGRVQDQGAVRWELVAPAISESAARDASRALIELAAGNLASFAVPADLDLQAGDALPLTAAHPSTYDRSSGTRAPSSIAARVLGLERGLVTRVGAATTLLDPGTTGTRWLCPVAVVTGKTGDTVDVDEDTRDTRWFAAGEKVLLYNPGAEATESELLVVDSVATDGITFTSTPSSWVGAGTVVTYPGYSYGSSRQQDGYMYIDDAARWR